MKYLSKEGRRKKQEWQQEHVKKDKKKKGGDEEDQDILKLIDMLLETLIQQTQTITTQLNLKDSEKITQAEENTQERITKKVQASSRKYQQDFQKLRKGCEKTQ